MEIGIDSFASINKKNHNSTLTASKIASIEMNNLIDRIIAAEKANLDIFGIGEHHREEFLDSSPSVILAAAAAKTKTIKLTSAVTVLSAADPVRIFQQYATLDLISQGRAEIIAGRGSFSEAFPLFGYKFEDYNDLYNEKLNLLLAINNQTTINWKGIFRAPLNNQSIFPRPFQKKLPIWVGVGGTPASFIRAGTLGLPLMIAIIGGETHRFRPLIELYKNAAIKAGHDPAKLKIGIHCLGYVAKTTEQAINDFYPGYAEMFTNIGKERGWPPVTKEHFLRQNSPTGALLVGTPEDIAKKILKHSDALGGLSRFTFQMNVAALTHKQSLESIKLIGKKVIPIIKQTANKKN